MKRSQAALFHLWPSLLVLAILAGIIFFAWYPYPLLQFNKGNKFALLLVISATFIGPALTWVVYKKGKRGLMIDMIVIPLIQLAAIGWGMNALYVNRPYFMVFTVDRFEVLSMREVDTSTITRSDFLAKPLAGPIALYANMPANEQAFQKLLREVMFEGKPDLQFRPEFWSLYPERQNRVSEASKPLTELRDARQDYGKRIDELVNKHTGDISALDFVPALFGDGQFAVILNAQSGEVVDMLAIDPWLH